MDVASMDALKKRIEVRWDVHILLCFYQARQGLFLENAFGLLVCMVKVAQACSVRCFIVCVVGPIWWKWRLLSFARF